MKKSLTTLTFETIIHAPPEKVWNTMLADATYRIWTLEFNPAGSWYEGNWEEGSKMKFIGPSEDGSQGGMLSRIKENRPYEFISIEHYGFIENGKEVTDSPSILEWTPSYENYTFTEAGDDTKLTVEMQSTQEFAEMFNDMWPRALEKLKVLCER
jgi:uncharacterized protein YndB with AHSA1/START domain